jgi:hypothetical protein
VDLMNRSLKFTMCAALLGFAVASWLCADAYHLFSSDGPIANEWVYLILCPASIGSIGLDNATLTAGLLAWLFFGLVNAVLYGTVGWLVDSLVARSHGRFERRSG